jgi:hypothetical protein
MSLLRLLTAGRSLVGLKKTEVRYHLPGGKAFPKFGSKKNPFRATALPEKAEPLQESANQPQENSTGADGVARQQSSAATRVEKAEARGAEALGAGGSDQKDSVKMPAERAVVGEAARASLDVTKRRRGSAVKAFLLWGRAKKGKVRGLSAAKPLVQGELSLDRVKVVRNDLSESDLEIVRASQPAVPKGSGPAEAVVPKAANALPGWGAAASRLLGLSKP